MLAAVVGVMAGACASPTRRAAADLPLAVDLHRVLAQWRAAQDNPPAVAIAVVGADGAPRVANSSPDLTADDAVAVASVTKVLVALTVLKMQNEGVWSLDDPADRWLDGALAAPAFAAPPVSLRHLLSHTAGVRDPAAGRDWATGPITPATPPGLAFSYSNEGYGLLARAIARADGRDWTAAVGARTLAGDASIEATFAPADRMPAGSVGLMASASDLARIGQWFIDEPAAIASPAIRRRFQEPALDDGSRPDRLLSTEALRARSGRLEGWMHSGRGANSGAELVVLDRRGVVIAVVTDAAYDARVFGTLRPLLIEACAPGLRLGDPARAIARTPPLRWPDRLALTAADGSRLTLTPSDRDAGALTATLPDARSTTLWPVDGAPHRARRWVAADSRDAVELQGALARATGQEFEVLAHGRTISGVLWQGVWYGK